jgi:hypothetical protein
MTLASVSMLGKYYLYTEADKSMGGKKYINVKVRSNSDVS